jgi:glutathione S-transferase
MIMHHIPVCPFSQRVEILLKLKGLEGEVGFNVVDITKPRPAYVAELLRGTTAMPVLEIEGKAAIKESMVILRMIEALFPDPPVARRDPHEHALESILVEKQGPFTDAGYAMVLNQELGRKPRYLDRMLGHYRAMNAILLAYAPGDVFFFDGFGWAETVFTPIFQRFWFLEYYEGFELPQEPEFDRVRRWREACITHPAAARITREEIVKVYYDYAKGAGNGGLLEGREVSSFVFEPAWRGRPWPPADKYGYSATDRELGLV